MQDKQIKIHKYSSKHEALDLRKNRQEKVEEIKKINSPASFEYFEGNEKSASLEKNKINEGQDNAEQANSASIIATGQTRKKQEARYKKIENILESDLEDLYLNMDQNSRSHFKRAGEDTVRKINILITEGKATAKKIVVIIKKWLSLIPGVNRFFLEQEAKIKTDKIMNIQKLDI